MMQRCTPTGSRERLFVYGTLRPGAGHFMGRVLSHNARPLGIAAIRGCVVRTGAYPVVKTGAPGHCITGELFEVTGGRGVWRVLDRYEGCEDAKPDYERRRVKVRLAAGGRAHWTRAWCYVMTEPREASDANGSNLDLSENLGGCFS